jgi:argininosuccinate synthase
MKAYQAKHNQDKYQSKHQNNFQEDVLMKEKVVLAYSGGLDTTAIIPWLKEHFNYDVVCCCIDCGQGKELEGLEERAKLSGASKLYIEDLVDDFCDNYIMPCVKANAVYENEYLLGTSMARPAIAKRLVDIARKEGAVAICHGATGKGNDQIRFELSIKALAPDIKIIAPWRMTDVWTMQSREDEIEYCKQHGIDLPFDHSHSYSRDSNIWHVSHEGLELEDPSLEPNFSNMLVMGVTPEQAPDEDEYVTMTFEKGVPTSVNGVKMKVSDIIRKLNELGGKHGIGIVDIVENRVVGMKSRGVYETPGGTILMAAHKQLEELVLDRATMEVKKDMGNKLAQIVYEGKWFTPLCDAVKAFVESTQEYVTGEVKFKLYKGNIIKAGTTSPYSLYSESLASFTTGDLYDHHDADGFITLFGLPLKVRAMKLAEMKKENNQK